MKDLIKRIIEFRDKRNWNQFHDSKNLALALSIECAELNELFLWLNDASKIENINKDRLSEELADVLIYAILLAEKNDLDIKEIISKKIDKNNIKYPVSKAKDTAKKYTEL